MSWQRVRGHDALVAAFTHAWQRGRLAHAYLFTGPPGVGKKLFATELGRALLCEGSRTPGRLEACDRCPACVQIDAGTHPDFFTASRPEDVIDLPIAVMRTFCDRFSLRSARGRGKVALLDDADDLNAEAANCFLKTLEEPPPGSVVILIGTSAERQLPTIVSRCQVVRFLPLAAPLLEELLRAQGVEQALAARLARMSGGSLGHAMDLADPALWEFRRKLLDGLAEPRPDSVALARSLWTFVEAAGKSAGAQRRRASSIVRLVIEFLSDALRVRLGGTSGFTEADDVRVVSAVANRVPEDRLLEVLDRCLVGDEQIDRLAQLVLVLEALTDAAGVGLRA